MDSTTHIARSSQVGVTTMAAGAAALAFIFYTSVTNKAPGSHSGPLRIVFPVCLCAATFLWLGLVSHIVPEPYLDEVFHIPQAQRYCQGRFTEWDDKITTPPGLYWISILIPQAAKSSGLIASYACDPGTLRATNAIGLLVLSHIAVLCRREIEARHHGGSEGSKDTAVGVSRYALHTGFNIALFPLLFFFSGLYYTDVVSTAVVLLALLNHLVRVGREAGSSFASDLLTLVMGIASLAMRQTNVFWVVVFMGGLEAVQAVKSLRPGDAGPKGPSELSGLEWLMSSLKGYASGRVHDLPLHQAWPEGNLALAALRNPATIPRRTWPHLPILLSFAGFVLWNGGVVLGDKSNHVATIHLAQMLYVWAFFAFFSLPLFLPLALQLLHVLARPPPPRTVIANTAAFCKARAPWLACLAAGVALSAAVVRYNTIVHPFTLADNRHYMFYVFRYTIRRAPWVRFALILPYTLARWLVWATLAGSAPARGETPRDRKGDSAPFPSRKPTQADSPADEVPSSTALLLLLATALSLVTAPLVEPRYFIIPWVLWRLYVPAWSTGGEQDTSVLRSLAGRYDARLVLETAWFAAINAVTGYIFLMRPYVWRAEDGGELDGGRLQRFMW